MVAVGFNLAPDLETLELTAGCIEDADYYEVAPETLWYEHGGNLEPNGFWRRFHALREVTRRPFVAHGVGLSLGTSATADSARQRKLLARVREDHRAFQFAWYTDHLGASSLAGMNLTLPIPLPMTQESAGTVRARLRQMRKAVPTVGFENNVAYFLFGDPLDEPRFINSILKERGTHLLLDLHNVYTMSLNHGFDAHAWLDRVDLARVIEIHISGGADSDPAWLPDGRVMRLDSHDAPVPDEVWKLLEATLPRCPGLRGVTLERMEGTLHNQADARALRAELRQLRRMIQRRAA